MIKQRGLTWSKRLAYLVLGGMLISVWLLYFGDTLMPQGEQVVAERVAPKASAPPAASEDRQVVEKSAKTAKKSAPSREPASAPVDESPPPPVASAPAPIGGTRWDAYVTGAFVPLVFYGGTKLIDLLFKIMGRKLGVDG